MQNVTNELQKRRHVLFNVVSVINNMPHERLALILKFVREIEDTTRSNTSIARPLSKREQEVLTLVANGYSRKQVGESLGISANTAARHISTIYSKLEVSTIAEATRYAITNGLA